jgi:transcriptional regulator NrdR family protein
MTKEKKILIVKASGQKELFSEEKLWKSLEKSGVQKALIKEVVDHIMGELKIGY